MNDPYGAPGPYGAPPPGAPPPYGGGHYGPPPSHGPSPYSMGDAPYGSPYSELEDNSMMWLIVAIAGFWFGFGWITGPLSWYFGGQARNKYRALGRAPSSQATGAWVAGIVTTLISYLLIATLIALFVFFFGAFVALF